MKKRNLLVLTILIGFGISWWLLAHHPRGNISQPSNLAILQTQPAVRPSVPDVIREYIKKTKADPQYDWKQPINFYGRVVDEANEPVAGATASFEWNDISEKGTSDVDTRSDAEGFFSLTDRRGKRLYVQVRKPGYYDSHENGAFEYANPAGGLFTAEPNNPVVFHLRKKGAGVDLIISQNSTGRFMRIIPPINGSPVFLDFFNPQTGSSGQLKIEGWRENKDLQTMQNNWGFRLTVPDGGLVENTDEFPFEAPDTDYPSTMEWHFTDGAVDWRRSINKKYYIKFGNPPRYGKIAVDTEAFSPVVHLEYAINPSGSRNLEPK